MSPDERERIREAGIELARRTRAEQGLPPHITDPATLEQVARIVHQPHRAERRAS